MALLIAVKVHRRLTRRLSCPHIVALLQVERQLVLVWYLGLSMGRVRWRHSLSRERCHVKDLGVSQMHCGVWLLVWCKLSPSRLGIISRFDTSSCFPVLSRSWLQSLGEFQRVELVIDKRAFGVGNGRASKQGSLDWRSRLVNKGGCGSRARTSAWIAIGTEGYSMSAWSEFAAIGVQSGALSTCNAA